MTDPERDHLLGRIVALERRLRRWRLACLALLGLLLLPVVLGGLLGVAWVPRLESERARLQAEKALLRAEMESARAAEQQARLAAGEALQQAERQRAEDEGRRRTEQRPVRGKD